MPSKPSWSICTQITHQSRRETLLASLYSPTSSAKPDLSLSRNTIWQNSSRIRSKRRVLLMLMLMWLTSCILPRLVHVVIVHDDVIKWEHFSTLLAFCAGNSPVTGEFPAQRLVNRSFDVFFDLRLYKRLSKQSWRWWFETPSRSLWRHCNDEMFQCSEYSTPML